MDPGTFAITDLIVEVEKEPARKIFGERFLVGGAQVKVPTATIDKMGDVVTLKFGLQQLKDHLIKL